MDDDEDWEKSDLFYISMFLGSRFCLAECMEFYKWNVEQNQEKNEVFCNIVQCVYNNWLMKEQNGEILYCEYTFS